jgi:hypothetical protein
MNTALYPWLHDLESWQARDAIQKAREQYQKTGAFTFDHFITERALNQCVKEARDQEDNAYTTDDQHTAHLLPVDPTVPAHSVRNHFMRTQVASIAFDELPRHSELAALYQHPTLRELVSKIVAQEPLYLSEDPLGCCSINVFRPGYHHSFHFDESEFSTTLMLQESEIPFTGLFQYTHPLRGSDDSTGMALPEVAACIQHYDKGDFCEEQPSSPPTLHTLPFTPGTLSIFSGRTSLHRVTKVEGNRSRLVAVLTFSSQPGFRNSAATQQMFWGRSSE